MRSGAVFRRWVAGLILGGFLACFAACESQDSPPAGALARQAPGFELQDPSGAVHRLEEFKGGATVIHFWASWCPPCVEEIPRWIQAAPSFNNVPVKLVAISVDESWDKALKVFPKEKIGPNMVLLLDPSSEVSGRYGTHQFPESYLLNRDLKIVDKFIGIQDWSGSMIRFSLAKALAQPGTR